MTRMNLFPSFHACLPVTSWMIQQHFYSNAQCLLFKSLKMFYEACTEYGKIRLEEWEGGDVNATL
jgi:hypothetical protein